MDAPSVGTIGGAAALEGLPPLGRLAGGTRSHGVGAAGAPWTFDLNQDPKYDTGLSLRRDVEIRRTISSSSRNLYILVRGMFAQS